MNAHPDQNGNDLDEAVRRAARPKNVDSWKPLNLNELPEKPPIRPTLGNTSLIYPGKRHVFSGPPESAKTLGAYCMLIQTVRAGGVGILMDFEMGAYDARQRLDELGASVDEIDRILYLEPEQTATPARIKGLVDLKPHLVVIDAGAGIYSLEGLDDNKRADVEKISRLYVGSFWRSGIATILIDHVTKDTENRGRFVIGSERKLGVADVHIGFETLKAISRGQSGRYKLVTHKDRGGYLKRGHLADLALDSDPDTHAISWTFTTPDGAGEDGMFRPTHLMEKVSIYLETQPAGATRTDIATAIGGRKKYVVQAVDRLLLEGFANETGSGRSKLLASVRRYREADPDCNPEPEAGEQPITLCSSDDAEADAST